MKKFNLVLMVLTFVAASFACYANGSLVCSTPWARRVDVQMVERKVVVSAENGLAFMEVEDKFMNYMPVQCEGVYKFKLPEGAFASGFWINTDGKEWVKGEVREITQARQIYHTITSRLIDPGILEQRDGELMIRVFPVEPQSAVGIRFRCFFPALGEGERLSFDLPLGFSLGSRDEMAARFEKAIPAKFSFSAAFSDKDKIQDPKISLGGADIKNEGAKCSVRHELSETRLDDFAFSYVPATSSEVTSVIYQVPDGKKFSLLRLRNLKFQPSETNGKIAVIIDSSGSMGYNNRQRAIDAVKVLTEDLNVSVEVFLLSENGLKKVTPSELEAHRFFGPTEWKGLADFPDNSGYAGAVLISDGDGLSHSLLVALYKKLEFKPVMAMFAGIAYSHRLAVLSENFGGSLFLGPGQGEDYLQQHLQRAVSHIFTSPFLYQPDGKKIMPLFGSLSQAAYYVLPLKEGGYDVKSISGVSLKSFSVSADDAGDKIEPWFVSMAARQQIRQLELMEQTEQVIKRITELGIRYSQATDYTAFLAVPEKIARAHADAFNPAYLALVATPNFRKARSQARIKSCYANQRVLMGALEMYCMDNKSYEGLEHDLYTGCFKIQELVDQKFLKALPNGPERDCEYRLLGKPGHDGQIICMMHGTVDDMDVSVEEHVMKYCEANGLNFDDFDFPYDVYNPYAGSYTEELQYKLRSYELMLIMLSLML